MLLILRVKAVLGDWEPRTGSELGEQRKVLQSSAAGVLKFFQVAFFAAADRTFKLVMLRLYSQPAITLRFGYHDTDCPRMIRVM